MIVGVQVQRRAEALDQCHGAGEPRGAGETDLLHQEAGDGAVDCAQDPRQCIRIGREQESQRIAGGNGNAAKNSRRTW